MEHDVAPDVAPAVAPAVAPLPGWYPDPAGSTACRWWDGSGWTAHLQVPVPAAVAAVPVPAAPVAIAPAAPVAAPPAQPGQPGQPAPPKAYAGDPRFGGIADGAAGVAPVAPVAHHAATRGAVPGAANSAAHNAAHNAAHAAQSPGRPVSYVVAAGLGVLVLLAGAVFVGKAVLGGSGGGTDQGDSAGSIGGLIAPGNPQVAALRSDVLSIATAEETVYTDTQTYAAATSGGGMLKLPRTSVRLSAPGESVRVFLSPSGVGYCIRASRTPAGGGADQVVVYVSTQGGLQPPTVKACPAAF